MPDREALCRREDEGWRQLWTVVRSLSPEQIEEPGMTREGWSVKDLLWHLACWHAECAHVLERIRLGTYAGWEGDTDALNERFLEEGRRHDLGTVRATAAAARNRMLQEFAALSEVTPEAAEWFEESGPLHYREHLEDLRPWAERLAPGDGSR